MGDYFKRLNKAAEDAGLEANFYVIVDSDHYVPWDSADYIFLVMIGLLFVINVAVTIFDATPKSDELDSSIFRFFSMKRSLEIFLRRSKSKNVLSTFDGVRAISMTWVVLGHGLLLLRIDCHECNFDEPRAPSSQHQLEIYL